MSRFEDEDGIDGPLARAEERSMQRFMIGRSETDRMSWALECLAGDQARCGRVSSARIKRLATSLGLQYETLRAAWDNAQVERPEP